MVSRPGPKIAALKDFLDGPIGSEAHVDPAVENILATGPDLRLIVGLSPLHGGPATSDPERQKLKEPLRSSCRAHGTPRVVSTHPIVHDVISSANAGVGVADPHLLVSVHYGELA